MAYLFIYIICPLLFSSFQQIDPLAGYRWKNRVLLIFDDGTTGKMGTKQWMAFADQPAGIVDRELIILQVDQFSIKDARTKEVVMPESAALRATYNVNSDEFATLLIGKDGGIKLRRNEVVSSEEIFALIDSMPMRRSEMRRKNDHP